LEAVAEVGPGEMLDVRIGAEATGLADVANGRELSGRVVEAGSEGSVGDTSPAERGGAPSSAGAGDKGRGKSSFRIRIAFFETTEFASLETPIRVRIAAPYESVGAKAVRLLRETFRLD
jgi:hypothetical protein